jgi:DNA-binding response OmpR family regulator
MKNKRIVVFEEFDGIKNILTKTLENKNFEIIEFSSAHKFEDIFNGIGYSLIIIDNDNKNDASYNLVEKLRSISMYLYTPIVLLITGSKENHSTKYSPYNVACYLTKPFDMGLFHSVIDRLA